jgi:hypothetical protein
MTDRWTAWSTFRHGRRDAAVEAWSGPGVYEICNTATREQVAFGCTRNVAEALGAVLNPTGLRKWLSLRRGPRFALNEVEYRVWPTASFAEAKAVIGLVRDRRIAVLRRFTAARV